MSLSWIRTDQEVCSWIVHVDSPTREMVMSRVRFHPPYVMNFTVDTTVDNIHSYVTCNDTVFIHTMYLPSSILLLKKLLYCSVNFKNDILTS